MRGAEHGVPGWEELSTERVPARGVAKHWGPWLEGAFRTERSGREGGGSAKKSGEAQEGEQWGRHWQPEWDSVRTQRPRVVGLGK